MGRIEEEWANTPVIARVALIRAVYTGPNTEMMRYGSAAWEKVPENLQQLLTPVLIPDTDAEDRAEKAGWSGGKPVYRASMAGHCTKELYLWRVGAAQEFTPTDRDPYRDKGELGAQEGSLHEGWMVSQLAGEGYEITSIGEEQEALELRYRRFVVRAHPDGLIRGMELGSAWRVLECKALNQDRFDLWKTMGWAAFPRYAYQVALEMFLATKKYGVPVLAFFVVKNRNTGESVRTLVDRSPVDPALIINKFSAIEDLVENGGVPPCDDTAEWYFCPFLGGGHCDAMKKKDGSGVLIVEEEQDPEFVNLLKEYRGFKEAVKVLEEKTSAMRALLIERMVEPAMRVGEYFLKVSQRTRTGWAVTKGREWIDSHGGDSSIFETTSTYTELRVTGGKENNHGGSRSFED